MSWPDHYWSENEIRRLKELWMEGLTTRVIGMRLGVSKNAVVGKIRRLGMSNSRPYYPPGSRTAHVPLAPVPEPEPPSPPKPKRERKPAAQLLKTPEQVSKPPDPPIGAWTLMDLRYGVCKWPEGEQPPYRYCGDEALENGPYCSAHHQRAHPGPQHRALRPIESYAIRQSRRAA